MLSNLFLKSLLKIKLLMAFFVMVSPMALLADNHGEGAPGVMEIYQCDLINGATADDVLKFGRGDFSEFAADAGNEVRSFLWTPVTPTSCEKNFFQ